MATASQTANESARVLQFTPRDPSRPLNYRMAAKENVGEILLYDSIGGWFGVSAKQFAADLKAMGDVKTINLRVNSDGGDVFDGRAIYTQLAQHPARVVAHIDGLAASIASLIVMAANEIRLADGAWVMIHEAWGVAMGDATEMRRMADLLTSVTGTIQDTYAARTRQTPADIKKWMSAETWMTGQEAIDRGFADVLDEPVKAAALLCDPSRFKHPPAALLPRRVAAITKLAALKRA